MVRKRKGNRNKYDLIYDCLDHCVRFERHQTMRITKSRLLSVVGGNVLVFNEFFTDYMMIPGLIEVNKDVNHYTPIYRVTPKGKEFIKHYKALLELLNNSDEHDQQKEI